MQIEIRMSLADKVSTDAEIAWFHKPATSASTARYQNPQQDFGCGAALIRLHQSAALGRRIKPIKPGVDTGQGKPRIYGRSRSRLHNPGRAVWC